MTGLVRLVCQPDIHNTVLRSNSDKPACVRADVKGLKQVLLAGKRGAAVPAHPVAQHKRVARCIVRASGLDKKKINKVSHLRSLLQQKHGCSWVGGYRFMHALVAK